MQKIIIEFDGYKKIVTTYDNGEIVYPIFEANNDDFIISETTNSAILGIINELLNQIASAFRYQLTKKQLQFNAINKSCDSEESFDD